MITVIDTIRAVSALVEDLFGEPPTTKDVTEGFTRPCTYVQPTLLDTAVEGGLRHDSFTVEIIRFAQRSRKGYLELLAYQEQLTEALEILTYRHTGGAASTAQAVEVWPELAAVVEITVTRNTGGAAHTDQALEVWPELTEQIEATTELDRGGGTAASQVVEIYPEGGG